MKTIMLRKSPPLIFHGQSLEYEHPSIQSQPLNKDSTLQVPFAK